MEGIRVEGNDRGGGWDWRLAGGSGGEGGW